jgi:hypothetical protein
MQHTYAYDAANRISSAGFSYDAAGRLLSDGTNIYTWDRASGPSGKQNGIKAR